MLQKKIESKTMKHFCKLFLILILFPSFSCGWITGPDDEFDMSGNIVAFVSSVDWSLYYMNIDTGERKKVEDEVFGGIRWSRDGSKLAFNGLNFFKCCPTNDFPLRM